MANTNLSAARNAKNDEFYTQYADIQKEVNAYLEYDPDVFKGKTILLPCDDPEWYNFTKFFAQNFERLGLKKLISTSYAIESKNFKTVYQPTLGELKMTIKEIVTKVSDDLAKYPLGWKTELKEFFAKEGKKLYTVRQRKIYQLVILCCAQHKMTSRHIRLLFVLT